MSLIPWKPFSAFDDLFNDDDWLVPTLSRTDLERPAMDIYETGDAVVAELSIPDFDPEDIDVSIENGMLHIMGEVEHESEKDEKKKGYWRKEIRKGSFERMASLPVKVREDEIDASYKKGVLKITMPKDQSAQSSKTKVKVRSDD